MIGVPRLSRLGAGRRSRKPGSGASTKLDAVSRGEVSGENKSGNFLDRFQQSIKRSVDIITAAWPVACKPMPRLGQSGWPGRPEGQPGSL